MGFPLYYDRPVISCTVLGRGYFFDFVFLLDKRAVSVCFCYSSEQIFFSLVRLMMLRYNPCSHYIFVNVYYMCYSLSFIHFSGNTEVAIPDKNHVIQNQDYNPAGCSSRLFLPSIFSIRVLGCGLRRCSTKLEPCNHWYFDGTSKKHSSCQLCTSLCPYWLPIEHLFQQTC